MKTTFVITYCTKNGSKAEKEILLDITPGLIKKPFIPMETKPPEGWIIKKRLTWSLN